MELLPLEIVEMVAKSLTTQELALCCAVSQDWREIFGEDIHWRPRCDQTLEEPLRTTPCMVKPVFTSPAELISTGLSPISRWRLAYMRETHLRKNWKQDNYLKLSHYYFDERNVPSVFVSETYVIACSQYDIELKDVTNKPTVVRRIAHNLGNRTIDGIFVCGNIVTLLVSDEVHSFYIDLYNCTITKVHCFSLTRVAILSSITSGFKSSCVVKNMVFFGFIKHLSKTMQIWNLESGTKQTEVSCPKNPSNTFVDICSVENTTDMLVLVSDQDKNGVKAHGKEIFHFHIYDSNNLNFLPFTYSITSKSQDLKYALIDTYVAIGELTIIKVFNYRTLKLLHTFDGMSTLSVVRDSFVFCNGDNLLIYQPREHLCYPKPCPKMTNYKITSDKVLQLIQLGVNRINRIHVCDNSLNVMHLKFYGQEVKVNAGFTRVVVGYLSQSMRNPIRFFFTVEVYYMW